MVRAGERRKMFDLFGEFNSVEEMNKAAEGFKNEGDIESLKKMAAENGIDEAFADMYASGAMPELCDVAMAAIGKITVEAQELKPVEIVEDWTEYVKASCMENEELAAAVRRKGKSLKGCIAVLLKWSFQNCYAVDKEIVKAAGVSATVKMGIPGMGRAKKLIKEYYLGK